VKEMVGNMAGFWWESTACCTGSSRRLISGPSSQNFTKCGVEPGAWEQEGGALGFFESGGKIAKAILVGRWYAAVKKQVAECLACCLSKMKRSRRQARMRVWQPKARFETIAVDVLELSPTSATGMKKVVVIGYVFTHL
jgi:hypothetical protein